MSNDVIEVHGSRVQVTRQALAAALAEELERALAGYRPCALLPAFVWRRIAKAAVRALLQLITEFIGRGQPIALPGFGSWRLMRRAAHLGTCPAAWGPHGHPAQRAERYLVPAHTKVVWRPAERLRQRLFRVQVE